MSSKVTHWLSHDPPYNDRLFDLNSPFAQRKGNGLNEMERDPNWDHEAERDRGGQGKHDVHRDPKQNKPKFGVPKNGLRETGGRKGGNYALNSESGFRSHVIRQSKFKHPVNEWYNWRI
ncbi:hypothetical protein PG996_007424 [Apiospora saccharicola]|uniref:Uncharacterized protein n=1 Tax=Apiospora saccharicola TaxID=335842 RepID=A0ABR1VAS8_9PEZI